MLYYCISKAKIVCSQHQGQTQAVPYPSPSGKYICIHEISKYIHSITGLWNSPGGSGDPGRLKASTAFHLPSCASHLSQRPCYTGHQQKHRQGKAQRVSHQGQNSRQRNLPQLLNLPVPNEDAGKSICWASKGPGPAVPWLCFGPEVLQRLLEGQQMEGRGKTISLGAENGAHT